MTTADVVNRPAIPPGKVNRRPITLVTDEAIRSTVNSKGPGTVTLRLELSEEVWPLHEPFLISRGAQYDQPVLQVRITDRNGVVGRGEACGVPYKDETPSTMMAEIEQVRAQLETGISRQALLQLLPPGGARMGIDSALWDLEAKRDGTDPFAACGVRPLTVTSAHTIGIRSLEGYEEMARRLRDHALLKVKVGADNPIEAVRAVRNAAPGPRLIIDPNQSWSVEQLIELAPYMAELGVDLLEQPIAVGAEPGLDGYASPVPLCADELIDDIDDLERARGRFSHVNIKLDKTGGLTAAMLLADAAQAQGFDLMVGCMMGSSLCMAPAMVLAQRCAFVDLDGPLLQSQDIADGFDYDRGVVIEPRNPLLWG